MELLKMFIWERIAFHKHKIGAFFLIFLGFVVLTMQAQSGRDLDRYAIAEEKMSLWLKNPEDDKVFLDMKKALKKVPDLEKKYGAMIAQELFQRDHFQDALGYAEDALKNLNQEAPFHAVFGATTVLIEKGSFQDALEQAVHLKQIMETEGVATALDQAGSASVLYAHNLLRIACLQKELLNKPGEKAAWDELESFLKQRDGVSKQVLNNFRDHGLDLSHYIQERKKSL